MKSILFNSLKIINKQMNNRMGIKEDNDNIRMGILKKKLKKIIFNKYPIIMVRTARRSWTIIPFWRSILNIFFEK